MSSFKPAMFSCPLSLEIMEDPIMDQCAHTFERSAVLEWLRQGHTCCPISRKPMSEGDLVPNHVLAEQIEKWKWKREVGNVDWESTLSTEENLSESGVEPDGIERDVEMGHKQKSRRTRNQRNKYHSIPRSASMFLPQELRVLEMTRAKADSRRAQRYRQACLVATKCAVALVGVLSGGYILWKYVQARRS